MMRNAALRVRYGGGALTGAGGSEDEMRGMNWVVMAVFGAAVTVGGQEVTNTVPAAAGPPRWEVGVVGMGARLPLYRGSDEFKTYAFPLPYGVYRGDIVQADREGVRGLFYRGRWVETDLSFNGNPPVSDDARAREGMPDLDPLVEAGPAVRVVLYRGKRLSFLHVEWVARGVASIDPGDLGTRYEGSRTAVSLGAGSFAPQPGGPWLVGGRTGIDFADREYHRYFYDVTEEQALPDRPAFQSSGGYGGGYISGFVLRRLTEHLSAAAYARWDHIDGAAYEDSPLVKTKDNYVVGAAVTWKLAESKNRVGARR